MRGVTCEVAGLLGDPRAGAVQRAPPAACYHQISHDCGHPFRLLPSSPHCKHSAARRREGGAAVMAVRSGTDCRGLPPAGSGGARRPRMRPSSRPLPATGRPIGRIFAGRPNACTSTAWLPERSATSAVLPAVPGQASHMQSGCRGCARDVEDAAGSRIRCGRTLGGRAGTAGRHARISIRDPWPVHARSRALA